MNARDFLLDAWERWDRAPKDETAAKRMVTATIVYAGGNSLLFSRFLAASRRRGHSREECLALWEDDEW